MPGFGSILPKNRIRCTVLRGAPLQNYLEIHPFFTASEGQGQGIGCAVEVRDRPELFKVVVRIDKGF